MRRAGPGPELFSQNACQAIRPSASGPLRRSTSRSAPRAGFVCARGWFFGVDLARRSVPMLFVLAVGMAFRLPQFIGSLFDPPFPFGTHHVTPKLMRAKPKPRARDCANSGPSGLTAFGADLKRACRGEESEFCELSPGRHSRPTVDETVCCARASPGRLGDRSHLSAFKLSITCRSRPGPGRG